jgi:hypothetical protein
LNAVLEIRREAIYRPIVEISVGDGGVVSREVGSARQDGVEGCRVAASGHKLTLYTWRRSIKLATWWI